MKILITENQFKNLIENIIKEQQDDFIRFRIRYEHDVIRAKGYDVFNDPRAKALVNSLIENGEEVGFTSTEPLWTLGTGVNEYRIDDIVYIVATRPEIEKIKQTSKYYNEFSSKFFDLKDGYWIYRI